MTSRIQTALLLACVAFCSALSPAESQIGAPWTHEQDTLNAVVPESSQLTISGSQVEITSGSALVEAKNDVAIRTPNSLSLVKRKSLAFVRVDPGIDHIFVLLGPMTLSVGHHQTVLNSGDEAIVTDKETNYKELVSGDDIGRRRFRYTKLQGNKTVALTEFSLVHAIEREPVLYQLVHSSGRKSKPVRERLIKMAAVLSIVTSRHGPYSTGTH